MIAVNRILLAAAVMTTVVAGHSQTSASTDTAQANDALTLVARIPVPQMTGTWDHLTVDPVTDRLFASAQEDNQVRVLDLRARKPLYTISGFNRPQDLYYVPGANALSVTNVSADWTR
jgi:hypothetical protein